MLGEAQPKVGLQNAAVLYIFRVSVRPFSTSTGPIFTQLARMVELRLYIK